MKNLIVYYSYEGNCESIVNGIKDYINADILKLTPVKEYKTKSMLRFVWGCKEVYMTKRPKLESYNVNIDEYDNIIICSPCWFGTYAPPINAFISENNIENKNIYLLVCNGGNLRNTWRDFDNSLKGNNIVSKLDLVYPIKNGIDKNIEIVKEWLKDIK